MSKKILVINGHSSKDSFCHALATEYAHSALANGHDVQQLHLSSLKFDPILHEGYRQQ